MISVPPHKVLLAIIVPLLTSIALPAKAQHAEGEFQIVHAGPGLSLHKEMFMLPLTLSSEYHDAQTEAVFQISAKHRLFNSRFYFAYTQISFWQAYDHHHSAPFRETNYNPEIFYRSKRFDMDRGWVGFDAGIEHESNGQIPPVSRSWNLLYACPYYAQHDLLIYVKLRWRIPESDKEYPEASVGDDNPDITDYYGFSDLHFYYRFWGTHSIHVMLRGNPVKGYGGASLVYSLPVPKSQRSRLVVRITHGYGESLVDYKRELTRLGVGIMFD